jgi:prepilin-type N-terminal cleavage/methylation domain-containing protein
MRTRAAGFTLIELLVALAIIALLLSVVVPRFTTHLDRAEEAALKHDLAVIRDALDKHYADTGQYAESLEQLVTKKYLRGIPPDPVSGIATTWIAVPPAQGEKGVRDVKSGAAGNGRDGRPYVEW